MADASMKSKVEKVIDKRVRPGLARDGGDIELVSVDEKSGEVKVKLVFAKGKLRNTAECDKCHRQERKPSDFKA